MDTWRERFDGGRLDAMRQSIEKGEARIEEIGAEIGALSKRIETDEEDASFCRNRAHVCADAESAEKEYQFESDARAAEISPDAFVDLRAREPEDLAGIVSRAKEAIVQQEALGAREAAVAERTRQEAARYERTTKEYRNWASTLVGVLHGESALRERIELPRHEEVASLVSDTISGLGHARSALTELREAYLCAHPDALKAPNLRRLLLQALRRLERDEVVNLPASGRSWDTSGSLYAYIVVTSTTLGISVGQWR